MPQRKKDFKLLNCKIEKEIAEQLDQFSIETGLSKTVTVEKALKAYIEKYNRTGKI